MSLGTCLIGPAVAGAYSSPSLYAADPIKTGGGGGRAFTGAPADGLDCGVCHRGGEPPVRTLRGGPGEVYTPGATYVFEVTWPEGAHVGVAVEAADRDGAPLGVLRLPTGDDLEDPERCGGGGRAGEWVELGERRPLAVGDCGASRLRFQWTAPDEPIEGDLYVAMVLADGEGTPDNDGALAFKVPLTTEVAVGGCAVDRGAPGLSLLVLLLLLRRRRLIGLVTLGLLGAGCARVQPHERGRLAQPDMQLSPDPDLTAGPEHALEYREGSAGGLGGGGGGCGCN